MAVPVHQIKMFQMFNAPDCTPFLGSFESYLESKIGSVSLGSTLNSPVAEAVDIESSEVKVMTFAFC